VTNEYNRISIDCGRIRELGYAIRFSYLGMFPMKFKAQCPKCERKLVAEGKQDAKQKRVLHLFDAHDPGIQWQTDLKEPTQL